MFAWTYRKHVVGLLVSIDSKLGDIHRNLLTLNWHAERIERKETLLTQQMTDLIAALDTATNKIAARLQALIDQAAQQGSIASSEIAAALQPEVDKLTALGADANNPVPA